MATAPMVNFRAVGVLADHLIGRREAAGFIASRDLTRYYSLLTQAESELDLSDAEWNLLRDILNGTMRDDATAQYLWAELADTSPAYGKKWGVDVPALSDRIRKLPLIQRYAIIDSVDRWWAREGAK